MSKIYSLSFRLPITISLMSIIMFTFLILASVYFFNEGITKSTLIGFQNTAVEKSSEFFVSLL